MSDDDQELFERCQCGALHNLKVRDDGSVVSAYAATEDGTVILHDWVECVPV